MWTLVLRQADCHVMRAFRAAPPFTSTMWPHDPVGCTMPVRLMELWHVNVFSVVSEIHVCDADVAGMW